MFPRVTSNTWMTFVIYFGQIMRSPMSPIGCHLYGISAYMVPGSKRNCLGRLIVDLINPIPISSNPRNFCNITIFTRQSPLYFIRFEICLFKFKDDLSNGCHCPQEQQIHLHILLMLVIVFCIMSPFTMKIII